MIKNIKVVDDLGNETTLPVGLMTPALVQFIESCIAMNTSGNLEISNVSISGVTTDSKVNIVSKSDIQVKPGDKSDIQLDCENNTTSGDPVELGIKVSNGAYDKSNRVVSSKINVAEITIDNQKAHTTQVDSEDTFDIDKLKINFRTDKWKAKNSGPTRDDSHKGPVDVKLRGKSFDIRCHGNQPGGGIALQTSGSDPNGFENKVKFESSRTSALSATGTTTYDVEGGNGMEFGTFNNEHTSLFTGDYRFNASGNVYAVVRGEVEKPEGSDKTDYPTQLDDFKDVPITQEGVHCEFTDGEWTLPSGATGTILCCTWADIINAALYVKSLND